MSGFDCTFDTTPILDDLAAAGVSAIGRYYSAPGITWKTLKRAEAQAISAKGMTIWAVYQVANNKPGSFSAAEGHTAATHALDYARDAIGQPHGSAIYFSVDYDASPADAASVVRAYFEAVGEVFRAAGSPYRIGVYGDGVVCQYLLDHDLVELAWLSQATAHAGHDAFLRSNRWALAQLGQTSVAGKTGDPDTISTTIDPGFFSLLVEEAIVPGIPAPAAVTDADAAPPPEETAAYPGSPIRRGSFGSPVVKQIQARLATVLNTRLTPDGDFGQATENAVKLFQARHPSVDGSILEATGVVDAATWAALFGPALVYSRAAFAAATPPRQLIVDIALSQLGVLEQPIGSNRGPQVDVYIRAAGLDPTTGHYAWCVCFIQWVFREAAAIRGTTNPLPKTAGVHALWQMRRQGATDVVTPDEAAAGAIRPGMIFLLDTGGGNGHAGIVLSVAGDVLTTVEGNTNDGGSREGYGVFRRTTRRVGMTGLLGYLDYL